MVSTPPSPVAAIKVKYSAEEERISDFLSLLSFIVFHFITLKMICF